MSKKNKIEKLQRELENLQKEEVSEEPTNRLDQALEEIQVAVKEITVKYKLSYYELFGVMKAFDIELMDVSKE